MNSRKKHFPAKRVKKRRKAWKAGFILFAVCFVFSSAILIRNAIHSKREDNAFEALREKTAVSVEADDYIKTAEAVDVEKAVIDGYAKLSEENEDYEGWLSIPGTEIDYPVMYTPDNPEYYLRRAFDKTESVSGCPFIGEGASIDSDCFIIYAHNMKNGTMFGTLDMYSDEAFYKENPDIYFYTGSSKLKYEIFAAVETRVLYADEPGFRYYEAAGSMSPEEFKELTDWLDENSIYETNIEPIIGEQILILSTCSYHTENGRFLIAARLVEENESL